MKNLEHLIIKYFEDNLNAEETEHLKHLLEDDKNKAHFKEFVRLNHLINSKTPFKYEKELIQFKSKTSEGIKLRAFLKYAAAILIFVSAGYFFLTKESSFDNNTPIIANNPIEIGTDKATLTLEDGTNIALEKGQDYIANNLTSNGEGIIYKASKTSKPEIKYNYLTIPRGGQYFIKLSDGTQVWLNSESQLKYPVSFIEGETRKVELIYGEAYFDVSPSTEHHGDNFKVYTQLQEVEVLGTEFNIKAFKDENNIYTTLVEGQVEIRKETIAKKLIPNQQSVVTSNSKNIAILNVNTYDEVSWKDGVFSFNNKPLDKMMKILSRWYNVDIHFNNLAQKSIQFTGELDRSTYIETILKNIEKTNEVKFIIKDKTIIIE
ncbi:FecR family protein [Flavivirga spongiicola]|uniref:FecR family protein n=1 Tax=Flavivirga spongiicola TaxID=421621 RepID=A0ABU7XRG4_9FLAO|nr:FecR family protein [Flavivirga sp. MEBiC05379]MDO5978366.1 FecR family protein [Flavivirga sp. MEBiC05379]